MSETNPSLHLRPIGVVRSEVKEPPKPPYDWSGVISTIEINAELAEALDGLEGYSHLVPLTDPTPLARLR